MGRLERTGRPPALALGLLWALGTTGCGGSQDPEPTWSGGPRPPDVVLILLDTLRADALSVYGNDRETAPFLASLAEAGTVFETAYSVSTWTAPSTASLLTGVYPDRHGVTRGFFAQFREGEPVSPEALEEMELLAISSEIPTLAERFQELGYDTYGLASNVNIGPEMEFERGFDRFERHDMQEARFLRKVLLSWKAEMDESDAPRFVYLHFNDVHKPYQPRPKFSFPPRTDDEVGRKRALYEGELSYLDRFLGLIHQDLGVEDDTLVVVAADHGEEFLEHGRFYHEFQLHVELNWIPLIVHAPNLRVAPGRIAGNVSLIDVAPTILDLIGFEASEEFDGASLADQCRAQDKGQPMAGVVAQFDQRPLILHRFESGNNMWGVILGDWKLIRSDEDGYLLYNRVDDPWEQTNVYADHTDRAAALEAILEEHIARNPGTRSGRTNVEIDEDLLERLKAAGYVGGNEDEEDE